MSPIKTLDTLAVPGIDSVNVIGRNLLVREDLMFEFAKVFPSCTEPDQ